MEVYKLEKTIENEKIDLLLAMDKIKNLKAQLSESLARRKEIVVSMKDTQYIEEKIEDICLDNSTKEANEVIKYLLSKNTLLQEEVKKLKKDIELQVAKSYGNTDQEDRAILSKILMEKEIKLLTEKLDERNNEVSQLSIQQVDLSRQLDEALQTINQLKEENEKLKSDLINEKQNKEKMITFEQSKNQFENRHKGKIGLGYVEQNDSSKSKNKKETNPTCTYCGKIVHISNRC